MNNFTIGVILAIYLLTIQTPSASGQEGPLRLGAIEEIKFQKQEFKAQHGRAIPTDVNDLLHKISGFDALNTFNNIFTSTVSYLQALAGGKANELDSTGSVASLQPNFNVLESTLASANPITTLINFDNLTSGAVIGSSYQNLGVQFTNFQILTQGVSLTPLATAPSFANVAWIPPGTNASINFDPAVASVRFIYGNYPTLTMSALQGNTILKTLQDTVNDFPRIDNIANFEGVGCITSLDFVQGGGGDTVLDNLEFTRTLHCSGQ